MIESAINPLIAREGSAIVGPSKQRYRMKGGLTENQYDALHHQMRKERPRNYLCEICDIIPPHELACIGEYKPDPENFRWMCFSCHRIFDFANGTRQRMFGDKNPFFGCKHTEETRQKMRQNHPDQSGDNNPNYGKKMSEEQKQKLRENHVDGTEKMIKTKLANDTLRLYGARNGFFGQKHTEESKQKMQGPRPCISGNKYPHYGKPLAWKDKLRGPRPHNTGDKNPFFGKKHSAITRLRMILSKSNRKAAKLMAISGTFRISKQYWMGEG